MDIDFPILGDDLPEGEAFPISGQQSSDRIEIVHSTSTTSAPMRKKRRAARALPTDTSMELRNKDLVDWNANYLSNMDAAMKTKQQNRVALQAKKDAEHFLWGGGMGGIAQHFAGLTGPNSFNMFIGDNFFEFVTGASRKTGRAGTKHDRDSGIDDATQDESRNVRQKTGEPSDEVGRGLEDEGFFNPGGDEVELPREGVTALDDHQIASAMPWNISASKHGSSALPGSKRFGASSRPGSRMVSASPLHGRGQPLGLEALKSLESDGDFGMGGDDFAMSGPSSPPTVVGAVPQISSRVREALSAEGANFLDFVSEAIIEKRNAAQAQMDPMIEVEEAEATFRMDEITFEQLLPPTNNSKMIACQGLMMVLTLGTKGMLDVQQPKDLGDINIKLTEQAKASQVVEISDDDEVSSDGGLEIIQVKEVENEEGTEEQEIKQEQLQMEEEGGGNFEEPFAVGHAAPEQDDRDELYDD